MCARPRLARVSFMDLEILRNTRGVVAIRGRRHVIKKKRTRSGRRNQRPGNANRRAKLNH